MPKAIKEKEAIERIESKGYTYISGFKSYKKDKCLIKCNVCNNEWEVIPHNIYQGRNCPVCANKKRGKFLNIKKINYLNSLLQQTNDGKDYEWLEEYKKDNKAKHKIKHLICGHEYSVRPNDFQQGYRCPECSRKKSKMCVAVEELLESASFECEKSFPDLINERHLKFDYLIKNKILLEIDGEQHFNSNGKWGRSFNKNKLRDTLKNEWVVNNKYILIRIHYKVPLGDVRIFITDLLNGKLNKEIINKYNLYVYLPKKNKHINKERYYDCRR